MRYRENLMKRIWTRFKQSGLKGVLHQVPRFLKIRAHAILALARRKAEIDLNGIRPRFKVTSYMEALFYTSILNSERPVLKDLVTHLTSDDVFWDIGAHFGTYSIVAAYLCNNVYAFEPVSNNASKVSSNSVFNNLTDRIKVFTVALYDRDGEAFLEGDLELGLGMVTFSHQSPTERRRVKLITADKLVDSGLVPTPSVIKIDVEGAEVAVLRGMERTLCNVRLVYCEVHKTINDRGLVEDILWRTGFSVHVIHERENEYFIRGIR